MQTFNGFGSWILIYTFWILSAAVVYLICLAVYRLYFSPLASFPGPKLAALTQLYAGYHDFIRPGQYIWVIEDMHKKYGPVVRVRPDTLCCNDPRFIEILYAQSPKNRREKYWTFLSSLSAPGSVLGTQSHEIHRRRRAALNPFFSKQSVVRMEPIIHETLNTLLYRLEKWSELGQPVAILNPLRAATKDIIHHYAFGPGRSDLEIEDCNADFYNATSVSRMAYFGTYFGPLNRLLNDLPPDMIMYIVPLIATFVKYVMDLSNQIERVKAEKEAPAQRTVIHEILQSNMPESEKGTRRLTDEAMVLVIAGTESTASTLSAIFYYLLSDRQLYDRVKKEIMDVFPDSNRLPESSKLESLPFTNSLVTEVIRLYPGVTARLDRVCPDEDLVYTSPEGKKYVIPAGVCCGMSAMTLNRNPDIYERPDELVPDRYLKNPGLQKYLFSFSKGGRACLGINLAYQELLMFTVGVFRKYSPYDPTKKVQDGPTMELYETTRDDIAVYSDYIVAQTREGSKGVRIIIRH